MPLKKSINVLMLITLLLLTNNLNASKDKDFQSWNIWTFFFKINDRTTLANEFHLRLSYDASRFSQSLIRPSISYHVNDLISITGGYTWVYSSKPLDVKKTNVHDIWQEILLKKNFQDSLLLSRSRLEERFIQRNPITSWRYRHLLGITSSSDLELFDFYTLSNEVFFLLNDNHDKADNRGYSENRIYFGLGKHVDHFSTIQIGYQHQHIRRFRQNNFNADMIVLNINTNLV